MATRVGGFVSSCPRCGVEGAGVEDQVVEPLFVPELQPTSMSSATTQTVKKEVGRYTKSPYADLATANEVTTD